MKTMTKVFGFLIIFGCFLFMISCSSLEDSAPSLINIENVSSGLYKMKANKIRGYQFDAYIYIPKSFGPESPNRLLVVPNNTGRSGSIQVHDEAVVRDLKQGRWGNVARSLSVPILMPVFPRPSEGPYYHDLTYDAMKSYGKEKRLDLQLINMIRDAVIFVQENTGILLDSRILMAGASASGDFVARFTIMHPDIVHAAVTSLNAGVPMMPVSMLDGKQIKYPFGIHNIRNMTGEDFDEESFKNVRILSMNGELDEDLTGYLTGNNIKPYTRDSVFKMFGNTIYDRCLTSYKAYSSVTDNFQSVLYANTGHNTNKADVISFLKNNIGDEFVPLVSNSELILNLYDK